MSGNRDALVRFLIEGTHVRGELVQLDEAWRTLLARHAYPEPVRDVLGEATAAAVLLAATIKFDGSLVMQASSDGQLRLLVVESTCEQTVRGLARWDETADPLDASRMLGAGKLAITIDPGADRDRYQGIVALDGRPLTEALEDYFARSEQLATRLWLAVTGERAAGLLLQEMPAGGDGAHEDEDEDAWNRCVHLAATLTDDELLGLEPHALLRRLFHQERIRVFEPESWRFHCGCSRERVRVVLKAMSRAELEQILEEEAEISADCEFCNATYGFDSVDVSEIFDGADVQPDIGHTRH